MTTAVEIRVPIEQFALTDTFSIISDLQVRGERFVAHDIGSAIPFIWVTADDFEAFEAALDEDSTVETFEALTESEDKRFYRMSWIDEIDLFVHLLLEKGGVITHAETTGTSWQLRMLFPERDSLSRTYEFCKKTGLSLTVASTYELDSHDGSQFGLTKQQHTILREAKQQGYYEIPRSILLGELAENLDIPPQTLSERLRRAHETLINGTIVPAELQTKKAVSPAESQ